MRLLLDTHFVLWIATDAGRLRPAEVRFVDRPEVDLIVSAVSIWELALKWHSFHASGDRKGPADPQRVLNAWIDSVVTLAPLMPGQAAATLGPEIEHSDPFDRLLLLQAQQLDARLFTRDPKLLEHPVAIGG